jgi:hypothetical protein
MYFSISDIYPNYTNDTTVEERTIADNEGSFSKTSSANGVGSQVVFSKGMILGSIGLFVGLMVMLHVIR